MMYQTQIEAYLLGKLSTHEKSVFERALKTDQRLQQEVEIEKALQRAALEARLKPMVAQQFQIARRRETMTYALRMAAGLAFLGLLTAPFYTKWGEKPIDNLITRRTPQSSIPSDSARFGKGFRSIDALVATQLDTFAAVNEQLQIVIQSLREDSLSVNLLKINQLSEKAQELMPYFQALAYLKEKQLANAKALLKPIAESAHHSKKMEAISLLEKMN